MIGMSADGRMGGGVGREGMRMSGRLIMVRTGRGNGWDENEWHKC
jgi:hypothetical protein